MIVQTKAAPGCKTESGKNEELTTQLYQTARPWATDTTPGNPSLPLRYQQGTDFEIRVQQFLERQGAIVIPTGVEHAVPDQRHRWQLRRANTTEGNRLRFQPDFFCLHGRRESYAECKSSLSIERQAYEHYLALNKTCPVWLYFLDGTNCYRCRVSALCFADSQAHVRRFPTPWAIGADGWIQPPAGQAGCSGEPFRVVDSSNLAEVTL